MDDSQYWADLSFRFDDKLSQDPDSLPLELLPDQANAERRSKASALMLEIALAYRIYDAEWLKTHLNSPELGITRSDAIELLRNIFLARVERHDRIRYADFSPFGFTAEELALRSEIDRFSLGSVISNSVRLDERVASGGVAVVYKGVRLGDESIVAVKTPRLCPPGFEDEYAGHLRDEARIFGLARVEGIPQLLDTIETADGPVLILHWIDASTSGYPADSSLSEKLLIIAETARIVDRLHQRDLIHGDIKPANILVDSQNRVFLTDLNVTRSAKPGDNVDGPLPGSRTFMSQESLVGVASDADISQDIYALGCLLYEAISGRLFIKASGREEALVASILKGGVHEPEFLEHTPETLKKICQTATTRHVYLRFATAGDFAEALASFVNDYCSGDVPKKRPRLNAWRLGGILGLCLTRIRTLQDELNRSFEGDPADNLPATAKNALAYAIGAAIASDDALQLSEQLGWDFAPCPSSKLLMKYFYNNRKLLISDLDAIRDAAATYEEWFRMLWADIETRIAKEQPEYFLLLSTAIQARFTPGSSRAMDSWPKIATLAGLPEAIIESFKSSFAINHTREDWEPAIQKLEYEVVKWLRWPALMEASDQ